jgi:peptidoglycan-associated lipoprotein
MNKQHLRLIGLILIVALLAFSGAGCKKKPAPAPPPPPPPPPKVEAPAPPPRPTVSLTAKPSTIERGQSTTLAWESTDATARTLEPGLGQVPARGSMTVSPYESTTYRMAVKGPGGTAEASARVTVNPPPRPPAPPKPPEEDIQASFNSRVRDIYFDYDKSDIRPDAVPVLQANAEWLRAHPKANIVIEGHCDERGSAEYNLGLGDRRATAGKEYLVSLGIDGNRIRTISYGKEKPVCTEHNENCWQQNRHDHSVLVR